MPKDPPIAWLIQDDREKDIRVIRGREAASVSSVSLGTAEAGSIKRVGHFNLFGQNLTGQPRVEPGHDDLQRARTAPPLAPLNPRLLAPARGHAAQVAGAAVAGDVDFLDHLEPPFDHQDLLDH